MSSSLERTVSRETIERCEIFAERLTKWNGAINLVSPQTIETLWDRHINDSLQLVALSKSDGDWLDMGSGAGLPGLIVAAQLNETSPDRHVTLIESDKRKAIFMREAARAMGLDVTVVNSRIEEAEPRIFGTISARALSNLSNLLDFAHRLLLCLMLPKD